MKKIILLLLVFIPLLSISQTIPKSVKKADISEYKEYVKYCNEFVTAYIAQWRKFRIKPYPDGRYFNDEGKALIDSSYVIFYYKPDIPKYAEIGVPISQVGTVTVHKELHEASACTLLPFKTRRRPHSVREFYEEWMTGKMKKN